jgi:hypothetical protein
MDLMGDRDYDAWRAILSNLDSGLVCLWYYGQSYKDSADV